MKMKEIITVVFAVVSAASAALAKINPDVAVRADVNEDRQITKAEYVALFAPVFDNLDLDKDGLLTPAEYTHPAFKFGDADRNGMLTREEYLAIFENQFDKTLDKNKDGVLTASGDLRGFTPEKISLTDADKDGDITRDEYVNAYVATFDKKDKNKDEVLTPDEFPYEASFKVGDVNKDGQLTREEHRAIYERQFDGCDQRKVGILYGGEL